MNEVGIVGIGMTRFTRQAERGRKAIVEEAVLQALRDCALEPREIGSIFCGSVRSGTAVGQRCLRDLPFQGAPIINVENACASSSTALREAYAWIRAGFCDVALALGVEITSTSDKGPLSMPKDEWIFQTGLNLPMWYAMQARRHMERYGSTREQLATVAVKSRSLAVRNPKAHFQTETTLEEVLGSRQVADPLTLYQCCPKTDGGSAVVVASREFIRRRGLAATWIRASALGSGVPVYGDGSDAQPTAARVASQALDAAGVDPKDLDVVEVHDAFTIGEVIYAEALGICEPGEGARYAAEGLSWPNGGGVAINPSGGLLSRGHPLGASGLAQIYELVTQLRGTAGSRQVEGARLAATHNMGASVFELDANVCSVFVLEKG